MRLIYRLAPFKDGVTRQKAFGFEDAWNGFVKVRFEDKDLSMFACDLRTHGKRVRGQPA
jgi:hypothetical protein